MKAEVYINVFEIQKKWAISGKKKIKLTTEKGSFG